MVVWLFGAVFRGFGVRGLVRVRSRSFEGDGFFRYGGVRAVGEVSR